MIRALNTVDIGVEVCSYIEPSALYPVSLSCKRLYDAVKKIIYIPIVLDNGKVTNRYILYQFNGQYFEHILAQTKSNNEK